MVEVFPQNKWNYTASVEDLPCLIRDNIQKQRGQLTIVIIVTIRGVFVKKYYRLGSRSRRITNE